MLENAPSNTFLFCDQWRGRSLSNKELAPLKASLKVKLKDTLHTHSIGARGPLLKCKGQPRFSEVLKVSEAE